MRIGHVSDLHLGAEDPGVVRAFQCDVRSRRLDVAVVSGDLTMRARPSQFAAARQLLDSLGVPWVSVPGNHDLPLFRVAERLVRPLGAYRRVLAADVQPFWRRDGVEILGVNTARPYFWTEGRVDARQRARIRSAYRGTGLRVLALHHPVLRSASRPAAHLVRGLRPALRAAADARVDVVLCGHHHVPAHADLAALWPGIGRHMVGILSGTAVSTRTRAGQPASWTILDWDGADLLGLQVRQFDRGGFVDGAAGEWARSAAGWTLAASR